MPNILTPVFRVSYPNVMKPKLNNLSGKQEYSLEALFPIDADISALKAAAKAAIVEKWGEDQTKWPKNLRNPIKKQGERTKEIDGKTVLPEPYVDGAFYLSLKSTQKPGLVNEQVEDIIDASEFYAGCFARATVSVYAYDQAGNRGVGFGLMNIQKVKDGDPLGSRTRAQDDFAPVTKSGPSKGKAPESAGDLFD